MRAVLADTRPLYALADPRDSQHERARSELDRLQEEQRDLVVPFPVLHEAHTLVLHRLGVSFAPFVGSTRCAKEPASWHRP